MPSVLTVYQMCLETLVKQQHAQGRELSHWQKAGLIAADLSSDP
jgi:hypothetical protein